MGQLSLDTSHWDAPDLSLHALDGSVERVFYFEEETGRCVIEVKSPSFKSKVLLTGRLPFVYPGQNVHAKFDRDRRAHLLSGAPVPVLEMKTSRPTNERDLRRFLKSGALPGIGPKLATLLARSFPKDLLHLLEAAPTRLSEISGVGPKRQKQIAEAWQEFNGIADLKEFLFHHAMPLVWSSLLWAHHRFESLTFLKNQPYEAVIRHHLAFDSIDGYGLLQGTPLVFPSRLRAGILDLLWENYKQGHCAYPEEKLIIEASQKLGVPRELIETLLEKEILDETLVLETVAGTVCIYLKEIWLLERKVAQQLLAYQGKEPPWGWFNSHKVLGWAQKLLHIQLAPLQQEAINVALSSSLSVITGGPGTGKTTLIRSLVAILETQFVKFSLCSPTGRAAQRLTEATGAPAQTLHRLLKFDGLTGQFNANRGRPLDLDLLLIDEASMIDLDLMSHLLDALPEKCALIFVGDADQIPPIGAGNVLQSLIDSQRFQTIKLADIFRQSEKSAIKLNAQRINCGQMPIEDDDGQGDFHYIPVHDPDEAKRALWDVVQNILPNQHGITDPGQIQIMVPMNKGPLGTHALNDELQEMMDLPADLSGPTIRFGQNFKPGDKVMVTKNDYRKDVFNGDIGFIEWIDPQEQFVDIQFDGNRVRFNFDELDKLTLAYAISIHKSQGSEYRAVIVLIGKEHASMAHRHLIYTAVTRGKEQVYLIADPTTLRTAVLSDESNRRWQKLTELLRSPPLAA